MKNQALFSSKDKSKKLKCRLLQFFWVNLISRLLVIILALYGVCDQQRRERSNQHARFFKN